MTDTPNLIRADWITTAQELADWLTAYGSSVWTAEEVTPECTCGRTSDPEATAAAMIADWLDDADGDKDRAMAMACEYGIGDGYCSAACARADSDHGRS